MLDNPPCIIGLAGCNGGDASAETSGSSSSAFSVSHWNGYSSSTGLSISSWSGYGSRSGTNVGNFSSASGSSGSAGFHVSSAASAGASALNSAKDKIANYVITAKNKTSQFLSGVQLIHGPLPKDSVFDPALSSPSCQSVSGVDQGVECTMDLGPGESKQVNVAYHVKNSLSCLLARALQTAKTTVNRITGSAADQQVQTSVSCNVSAASSSGSAGAGSYIGRGNSAGTSGMSSGGYLSGNNGNVPGGAVGAGINGQSANSGLAGGTGYDYRASLGRGNQRLPQTGVRREYFYKQFSKMDLFTYVVPSNSDAAGLPVTSVASILLVGAIVLTVLIRTVFGIRKCKT